MAQASSVTFKVKVTPLKGNPIVLQGQMANGSMLVVYPQKRANGIPEFFQFLNINGVWKNSEYGLTAQVIEG